MHIWRKVICFPIEGELTEPIFENVKNLRSLSKGSDRDKLFLVKVGKTLESICMEGQSHIFTFDLILSGSTCHAKGSGVQ